MPSQCKLDAIAGYGAQVEICPPGIEAREAACKRLQEETGAVFIPPYNYAPVMAGQVCMSHPACLVTSQMDSVRHTGSVRAVRKSKIC